MKPASEVAKRIRAEALEEAAGVFPTCGTDHSKLPSGVNCFYCFYADKIRALKDKP